MIRKVIIFFCIGWVSVTGVMGQVIKDDRYAEVFAFRVKLLDEFFERFNNDSASFIRSYANLKATDKQPVFTHEAILKSLFDLETHKWDTVTLKKFIGNICNSEESQQLSFHDDHWYALLDCTFLQNGKSMPVKLAMQMITDSVNGSMKWVICGVLSSYSGSELTSKDKTFISPTDYGVDFMSLEKALNDKRNLPNYLPVSMNYDPLSVFVAGLSRGEIKFVRINEISYHFLQITGWIFSIEYFVRDSYNSGWLISQLIKTGRNEFVQKSTYKKTRLGIFNN